MLLIIKSLNLHFQGRAINIKKGLIPIYKEK